MTAVKGWIQQIARSGQSENTFLFCEVLGISEVEFFPDLVYSGDESSIRYVMSRTREKFTVSGKIALQLYLEFKSRFYIPSLSEVVEAKNTEMFAYLFPESTAWEVESSIPVALSTRQWDILEKLLTRERVHLEWTIFGLIKLLQKYCKLCPSYTLEDEKNLHRVLSKFLDEEDFTEINRNSSALMRILPPVHEHLHGIPWKEEYLEMVYRIHLAGHRYDFDDCCDVYVEDFIMESDLAFLKYLVGNYPNSVDFIIRKILRKILRSGL